MKSCGQRLVRNRLRGWFCCPHHRAILATLATVIASQALISGAFSITMQAVQLGFLPRLQIFHTSATEYGQIYMPAINWALMVGCIALVAAFRSSTPLAAAYGIAVTSTMAITTFTFYIVMRERWNWSLPVAGLLTAFFLAVDLAFLGANALKILDGGWMLILIGIIIFTVMTTWKAGRRALYEQIRTQARWLARFLQQTEKDQPHRVPGTAVFLTGTTDSAPSSLVLHYKCNKALHEQIVLLHVQTKLVPHVEPEDRSTVKPLGQNFYYIELDYGFMENPDIPNALTNLDSSELVVDPNCVTYFLGRQTVLPTENKTGMDLWREKMYAFLSRNATSTTAYFCLPVGRVVEMVTHVEI